MKSIKAYAKINLYLSIGSKLPNSYHQVRSIMQTIDLSDELFFFLSEKIRVESDDQKLGGEADLAYKAAKLLKEKFNVDTGIGIDIRKRIPVAAGLGGGSSNAAATLVALNKIWSLNLPTSKLETLAAELGSDVPFFIRGGTRLIEGYGQIVSEVEDLTKSNIFFVIANPGESVSAKDVYTEFDKLRPVTSPDIKSILLAIGKKDVHQIADHLYNGLEMAALKKCQKSETLKNIALKEGALGAVVSGSGPTVVSVFDDEERAKQVNKKLRNAVPYSYVCRAVNQG